MRHKSGKLRDDIRKYIDDFFLEHGRAPYADEIAKANGTSKSTAYRYLLFLDETGMIKYDGKTLTTPLIDKYDGRSRMAAVYGTADDAAEAAQDEIIPDAYVSLPEAIFGSGEMFLLEAERDEPEFGIAKGDYVAAERRNSAKAGELVIVEQEGKLKIVRMPGDLKFQGAGFQGTEGDTEGKIEVKGVICRVVRKL